MSHEFSSTAEKSVFHVEESRSWFREDSGWPAEVAKNMEFPSMTLGEVLRQAAQKWPYHEAIWFLGSSMTYRELSGHVDAFSTALHQLGVRKGDVVALLLPNSTQYVISYYAAAGLGAVISAINPTYKPKEILHQLTTVGAKVLICLDALYKEQIAPIRADTGIDLLIGTNISDFLPYPKRALGKLIKRIPSGNLPEAAHKFTTLLAAPIDPPPVDLNPKEDPLVYIMTGGTTGLPKAAVLTHFNCVSNALQCKAWLYRNKAGDGSVGILPLFHSFAMTTVMNTTIAFGGKMILFPKPPPMEELAKTLNRIGPDSSTMVGTEVLFKKLTRYLEANPKIRIDNKLQLCVSGAGPLHSDTQERFEKASGGRLVEGYGLTETSPVVSAGPFRPKGKRSVGNIGLPFPGTEWKIVHSADPTVDLGTGKGPKDKEHIGEIAVTGPQVMKEYLNQPVETKDTIFLQDNKRWLLTGDLGFMDEGGRIVILDRKKQLIKNKGYSVLPNEVELIMEMHPDVEEVAVAGLHDDNTGEAIKAWVVLNKNAETTEEEILAWAKENLAHYKVPKYIEIRQELPRSLIGKILKRLLQEEDPIWKAAQGKFRGNRPQPASVGNEV